jgi:hypothetical protein
MYFRYFLIFSFLILTGSLYPQNKLKVNNHSFEVVSPGQQPDSWLISNGKIDNRISIDGENSVFIHHQDWNSSQITSDVVELKIGHLYKLSAWIKTEGAFTNPIDRYPTPVAACVSMESFPFTYYSASSGATREWTQVEVQFIASSKKDRIKLHFGHNGKAIGKVWFDNIELIKIEDISEYIPPQNVKWFDKGFRYDDKGWIFVHIEGQPYERGYQYGHLIAEEMAEFINKLAIQQNKDNNEKGWNDLRYISDAYMLRKYEDEFIYEMKGIADGANKAGIKIFNRKFDVVDIVTMNSAIDIDYSRDAMRTTGSLLSGQSFLKNEDELNIPNRLHKCSAFLANKSSTTDGRIVFGQIFMWGGYTGSHWNVICDILPSEGNRLVYQTFPGGIHSGADFYMNSSGIMLGETTVAQTPFNPDGTPQSNRIRKAAQYANSIDDVVKILTTNNNGMYTNDWLIGDTKTDEIAVLLLGTYKHKLWRSGRNDFYGNTRDFYWCNNNNKDMEVRKEYIYNPDNAPFDLIFNPWNRDIAFNEFYDEYKGRINAIAGVNLWASSPINRPHACDGKVTTSEMAENLVFLAHYGKVTLREKFVGENNRVPDLPGATPHLSLGYSIVSPVFIADKLKEKRNSETLSAALTEKIELKKDYSEIIRQYNYDTRNLWMNTVYPSSESENWFISATAAYWNILKGIPASDNDQLNYIKEQFAELNCRYMYVTEQEGTFAPVNAKRDYKNYNSYQIPRIKGTYLLHQLRLLLGNDAFNTFMNNIHTVFREKTVKNSDIIKIANQVSGRDLTNFINQWIARDDLPDVLISMESINDNQIKLKIKQLNNPYHLITSVKFITTDSHIYKTIEIKEKERDYIFDLNEVISAEINILRDYPLISESYYTWSNIFDNWKSAKIVYGTTQQIEANHTLATRFSTAIADRFTEDLIPVIKESELTNEDLKNCDLILLGSSEDNNIIRSLAEIPGLELYKNSFKWNDKIYSRSDEGLFLSLPNPYNPSRVIYIFMANSAPELYQMTKTIYRIPQWGVFRGDKIIEKGYYNQMTILQ